MIQEVRRSIHFSPYEPQVGRKRDDNPAPTVSIARKKGRIVFSGHTLEALSMTNKFVAFYYEPTRKIIGWRVTDKLPEGVAAGKYHKYKFVKPFGKGKGFWLSGIKGILDQFKSLKSDNYKDLEVKKYIETASMLDKNEVTYFVEVKEKTDKLGNELIEAED